MGDAAGGLTLQAPAAPDDAAVDTPPVPHPGRWRVWRSPPGQPGWARPLLLVIAALAALSYAWGINDATLETFYGAAVRSMSQSWRNFFFGAFDPWGTVTVDKLPGAFWVQALSVRLFGFHVWSVVLPQAMEGTLTVLVLYRAVRRVAGAGAGLAAAAVLAATPVTILLDRGNISDSLLILLLVLAADAATAAIATGRLAHLLVAGVWVGLAFQAKMLQAWLVLPALYLAYLLAAPPPALSRRVGHVALSALLALGVSLSWMLVVTLVPAHDRPYVDGSCNDSVFSQVFLYNGTDRITGATLDQPGCSPPPAPVTSTTSAHPGTVAVPGGPGRFLNGIFGRDSDWMLVPAAVALAGILVARRREPRTDPLRAATLLWGAWLFFTWCFFASSHFINSYYLAALAPPIAALCGLGLAVAWRQRAQPRHTGRPAGHRRGRDGLCPLPAPGDSGSAAVGVGQHVGARGDGGGGDGVVPAPVAPAPGDRCRGGPVGGRPLPRLGLGVGDRRGGRAGSLRLPLPAGVAHDAQHRRQRALGGRRRRPQSRRRPDPPDGQRRHVGDLFGVEHPHPRHRARVPPDRGVHRPGAEPDGGPVRRRRARRAGDRGAGGGGAADPQPRHAVGHRALQAVALPRSGQPHRGADDALLPLLAGRRRRLRGQTSRKRRMAMADPMEPIAIPTITTTTFVSKTSDPVMCMAVKMLLVVRPLPSWLMKR